MEYFRFFFTFVSSKLKNDNMLISTFITKKGTWYFFNEIEAIFISKREKKISIQSDRSLWFTFKKKITEQNISEEFYSELKSTFDTLKPKMDKPKENALWDKKSNLLNAYGHGVKMIMTGEETEESLRKEMDEIERELSKIN